MSRVQTAVTVTLYSFVAVALAAAGLGLLLAAGSVSGPTAQWGILASLAGSFLCAGIACLVNPPVSGSRGSMAVACKRRRA